MTMEFIKDIENNIKKFQIPTQTIIRNRSIQIINNFVSSGSLKNTVDQSLFKLINLACQFLTNNPNLILTKADKGNITVALNKTFYTDKIKDILQNIHTYSKITKNPLNKMVSSLKICLQDGKN